MNEKDKQNRRRKKKKHTHTKAHFKKYDIEKKKTKKKNIVSVQVSENNLCDDVSSSFAQWNEFI